MPDAIITYDGDNDDDGDSHLLIYSSSSETATNARSS